MKRIGIALSERSTWAGLIWLLTALGITLDQAQHDAIIEAGMALTGLLGVFWKDK